MIEEFLFFEFLLADLSKVTDEVGSQIPIGVIPPDHYIHH